MAGSFVFESGVEGTGMWCFDAYTDDDVTEIVGTKGKLRFSSFGEEPVLLSTADGDTEFAIAHPPHVQQPLIQSIVDELNGVGQCPSTGESAARTSWVMDQMIAELLRIEDQKDRLRMRRIRRIAADKIRTDPVLSA